MTEQGTILAVGDGPDVMVRVLDHDPRGGEVRILIKRSEFHGWLEEMANALASGQVGAQSFRVGDDRRSVTAIVAGGRLVFEAADEDDHRAIRSLAAPPPAGREFVAGLLDHVASAAAAP